MCFVCSVVGTKPKVVKEREREREKEARKSHTMAWKCSMSNVGLVCVSSAVWLCVLFGGVSLSLFPFSSVLFTLFVCGVRFYVHFQFWLKQQRAKRSTLSKRRRKTKVEIEERVKQRKKEKEKKKGGK